MAGARVEKKLASVRVKTLREPGKYEDGGGLRIVVNPTGAWRWVMRVYIDGKRIERGLGAFPTVSLEAARAKADEIRSAAKNGVDVRVEERKRELAGTTFRRMFEISFAQREKASPCVGVAEELGTKLREVQHHASMPWQVVPGFIAALRQPTKRRFPMTALALEFMVLTATRSGETHRAFWSEFDFEAPSLQSYRAMIDVRICSRASVSVGPEGAVGRLECFRKSVTRFSEKKHGKKAARAFRGSKKSGKALDDYIGT